MCSAWNEFFFFFFNDTATTEIYTLSLHDALPICFTEMGYTASIKAAAAPWAYGVERPSTAYQARLYKVALEEAQRHNYVRGVFLWKWFSAEGSADPLRGDPFGFQDRTESVTV